MTKWTRVNPLNSWLYNKIRITQYKKNKKKLQNLFLKKLKTTSNDEIKRK
jgi:hypothetical protein